MPFWKNCGEGARTLSSAAANRAGNRVQTNPRTTNACHNQDHPNFDMKSPRGIQTVTAVSCGNQQCRTMLMILLSWRHRTEGSPVPVEPADLRSNTVRRRETRVQQGARLSGRNNGSSLAVWTSDYYNTCATLCESCQPKSVYRWQRRRVIW